MAQLDNASAYWRVAEYAAYDGEIPEGGAGNGATLEGAARFLPCYDGVPYLHLPDGAHVTGTIGTALNGATDEIEVRMLARYRTYSSGSQRVLWHVSEGGSNIIQADVRTGETDSQGDQLFRMRTRFSTDGTYYWASPRVIGYFMRGEDAYQPWIGPWWISVLHDPANTAHVISTSHDDSVWYDRGNSTTGTSGNRYNFGSGAQVRIGSVYNAAASTGILGGVDVYKLQFLVAGSLVFEWDFTDIATANAARTQITDTVGSVVGTIAGSGTGYQPVWVTEPVVQLASGTGYLGVSDTPSGDLYVSYREPGDTAWTTELASSMSYDAVVLGGGTPSTYAPAGTLVRGAAVMDAAASTQLVVADASHAHTADGTALTQAHTLVVADAIHAHAADSPALTQASTLTVADADHAHSADAPTLSTASALTVADASHAHTADSPALTQASALVVADALHSHSADATSLSQAHSLAVADALHAHAAEAPTLSEASQLVVADASHAHAADAVALVQASALAVADAAHAHTAETPALTQAGALTVADTTHAVTSDNLDLSLSSFLEVQDGAHAHSADAPSLTEAATLTVQDASHAVASDAVALTQANALVVADATHAHQADNLTISGAGVLTVQEATHAHSADAPALTQASTVTVSDAAHAHTAEAPTLSVSVELTVADAIHAHEADNVTLASGVLLTVADGSHAHSADGLTLTQAAQLVVQSALHQHRADNIVYEPPVVLDVDDSNHAHTADNVLMVVICGALGASSSFAGPGIGFLRDHAARVWRLVETTGDYLETQATWEIVYPCVLCTFQRRNTVLSNQEPGVRPVGDRRIYLNTGPVLRDRDVFEFTAGPEIAQEADAVRLEVESIAHPRGHHIEVRAVEFKGELPNDS